MKSIEQLHKHLLNSSGVSIDSRSIGKDNLYFALKGDNFNGNLFAEKALELGAGYAIVDEKQYWVDNGKMILVENVLKTLQDLAKYHRQSLNIPIIGLTGSNGKTTTKELMHAVLNSRYNTVATEGNFNNHIGVPLTLLRLTSEHEIGIIEMGANHRKEIEFLCSLCEPTIGYITNFGKAHLEGFGGMQGVIKGKSELYGFLRKNNHLVLLNIDDTKQVEQAYGIESISFTSENSIADFQFQNQSSTQQNRKFVQISFGQHTVNSNLTGQYNFNNIAAAISFGLYFEIDIETIKNAIEFYFPSNNRSQVKSTEHNLLIIDAYNANPSSMTEAVKNMAYLKEEHKWLILGDMFELGEFEKEEHQKLVDEIEAFDFERVLLIGKAFSKSIIPNNRFQQFPGMNEALEFLKTAQPKSKTILLKGSRGMKLESCIPLL